MSDNCTVNTWEVSISDTEKFVVKANESLITDGHLIFKRIDGVILRAIAPGHWVAIRLVPQWELVSLGFLKQTSFTGGD